MRKIQKPSGRVCLWGQCFFKSNCMLPTSEGINTYVIEIHRGNIRLNHGEFTPDGGTWLSAPSGGRPAHYDLHEGETYSIHIDIQSSFGRKDQVTAVNLSLWNTAEFSYHILQK